MQREFTPFPAHLREGFIASLVFKSDNRRFTTHRGVLILVSVILLFFVPNDIRYWRGAETIRDERLIELMHRAPVDSNLYLRWNATDVKSTGITDTHTEKGNVVVDGTYLTAIVPDGWIIVRYPSSWKASLDGQSYQFSGYLAPLEQDRVDAIHLQMPDVHIQPVMFHDNSNENIWCWVRLLIFVLTVIITVHNMRLAHRRDVNPFLHPGVQKLERYGDIEAVITQIDAEVDSTSDKLDFGNGEVILTRNWVIAAHNSVDETDPFEVRRISSLQKAYRQHKTISRKNSPPDHRYSVMALCEPSPKIESATTDEEMLYEPVSYVELVVNSMDEASELLQAIQNRHADLLIEADVEI